MKAMKRLFNACLLRPADLPPSRADWEVIGVFNPGVVATEAGVVLLVRVAERPATRRPGFVALPRWDTGTNQAVVDWLREEETEPVDIRVIRLKQSGLVRLNFLSHLRVVHSRDGRALDSLGCVRLEPATEYEEFGLEDPRITRIGDEFLVTYVAVSRHGVVTALASTRDFKSFQRRGIIFPPDNKDVVLFPEKIGGRHHALHRPAGATPFTTPEMWLATSPDLIHWGGHEPLLIGVGGGDIGRVGAGTPPVRTRAGWLKLYHGNRRRPGETGIGLYFSGALLLELGDPQRVVGVSGPIFTPETEFERQGYVPDVVFPTGIVEQGDTVLVYYGAADTSTAVVEFSIRELLDSVLP